MPRAVRAARKRAPASYEEDALADNASTKRARGDNSDNNSDGAASASSTPPPAPETDSIIARNVGLPTRDKNGCLVFPENPRPEFKPNLSPKQVLQAGAFGGTYFRKIKSAVTGETYTDAWKEFPADWFEGLDIKVASPTYREGVNKYNVSCGQTLDQWEGSGWIRAQDPYGAFQWYCRFYMGRRTTDDERQLSRFLGVMGPGGRFKNQLIGKLSRNGSPYNDASISPVIRQTLLHWGYELTEPDCTAYLKKKKMPLLPKPIHP